jgi:hypothetical protein
VFVWINLEWWYRTGRSLVPLEEGYEIVQRVPGRGIPVSVGKAEYYSDQQPPGETVWNAKERILIQL